MLSRSFNSLYRISGAASLCLFAAATALAHGQAAHTATRVGDLQVGAGFVVASSDYISPKLLGGMVYADFDPTPHLGVEFVIHQADSPNADKTYERTYEIGGRYFRTYGIAVPYAKALIGRGVFNFPGQYNPANNTYGQAVANLAYNMYGLGGGVDLKVRPWLHLRGDYEYQSWSSFPPTGLKPQLYSVGLAYHFNGDLRNRR